MRVDGRDCTWARPGVEVSGVQNKCVWVEAEITQGLKERKSVSERKKKMWHSDQVTYFSHSHWLLLIYCSYYLTHIQIITHFSFRRLLQTVPVLSSLSISCSFLECVKLINVKRTQYYQELHKRTGEGGRRERERARVQRREREHVYVLKRKVRGNCFFWLVLDNETLVLRASNCHLFLSLFLSLFLL